MPYEFEQSLLRDRIMSEQTYNNQMIDRYLLGSLDEAETERLDGLSVTNDQFVDALQSAENDLVDAYVQGELIGDELKSFKSFYLASPLRREKVEFAQAFQGWAQANSHSGVHDRSPDEVASKRTRSSWLVPGILGVRRFSWQWGFAMVAMTLLIAAGLLVLQNVRLRRQLAQVRGSSDQQRQREEELKKEVEAQRLTTSQTEQEMTSERSERERLEQELKERKSQLPAEGTVVSLILTPPLRGAGQVPTLSLRPGTERVAAQLQLEAADYSTYQVSLLNPAAHETLWRSGKLKPSVRSASKALSVNFPAGLLKPQTYILQVSAVTASGKLEVMSDYPFKVVK
jgi:cytoskeletal protein RodZ